MCQFVLGASKNMRIHAREERKRPLIFCWFVLADDSLIRLPRVRNQMHIHDSDFPGQRIVNPGVGPFSSVENSHSHRADRQRARLTHMRRTYRLFWSRR